MRWNQTRLAAGIAAALLLGGTALAQGAAGSSGATGTAPGGSTATTPSTTGSDTASPSRSDTTGSTDTTATPSGSSATGTTATPGGSTETGTTATPGGSTAAGSTETGSAQPGMAAASGKIDKGLEVGLQKLHAANQAEIQMGQMAAQTAQDDQVKQFAQKMVDDHQKNDQQLQQLAQQAGVTLEGKAFSKESKQSEKEMSMLHKPGAGFDKRYMSHMVKDHQKDVREVASLAKRAHREKQTELASFLDQTHTAMQGHLKEARTIEKATKSEQRQGRRGAERSSGMSSPRSRSTGADTGAPGSDMNSGTDAGSSGSAAPGDTGSTGGEQQRRP